MGKVPTFTTMFRALPSLDDDVARARRASMPPHRRADDIAPSLMDATEPGDARNDDLHALATQPPRASDENVADASVIAERYDVRSVLGKGGMGQVWLCHDTRMGRDVAIKVAHSKIAAGEGNARLRFV